jgi:hypothetical protein
MISHLESSRMAKRKMTLDPELAAEAKSIVALAFRNGPIEMFTREMSVPLALKIRIFAHNANRDEEHHEAGGGRSTSCCG